MRETKKSVTCFLECEGKYLFIHRVKKGTDVDANRLNGIGGKLEKGENFLAAAIRETFEETGYIVTEKDCRLAGMVSLEGGYPQDWVIGFFVIKVTSMNIPLGNSNSEGNLIWINQDSVLNANYELVDDLHYLWKLIIANGPVFFAHSIVNAQEKIESISISQLS